MTNLYKIEFHDCYLDYFLLTRSERYETILKTLPSSTTLTTIIIFCTYCHGSIDFYSSDWDSLDSTLFSMKISTLRLIRFKLYIIMGAGFGLTENSLSQLSKVLPKIRSLGVEVRYSEVYELESWYHQ